MIKAVLFDIDGTLIRLDGVVRAVQKACRQMKIRVLTRKEVYEKIIGYQLSTAFKKLYPKFPERAQEFVRTYSKIYSSEKIRALPYVRSTLRKLKNNYKIGVVSTKMRKLSIYSLREIGITSYGGLIANEDVRNLKPHPEPLLKACKKLKVKPSEAVFVGDHVFDMQAAKRAGCYAIGILTGADTRNSLKNAGADKIIKNLKGLERVLK